MTTPLTRLAAAICRVSDGANGARWYQTLPAPSEVPTPIHLRTGEVSGILVIDASCYASMLAKFKTEAASPDWPGVLVDREHQSETTDGDTGAVAWAKEMEIRADGLWTRWDLTASGEPLVTGRTYAYRSPAMDIQPIDDIAKQQLALAKAGKKGADKLGVGRWRPIALMSIALTNKPHLDLAPALGREQSQQGDPHMDPAQMIAEIRKALGIDDTADVVAAVTKLVSDAAAATTECTAAKTKCTEAQTALATIQAKQADAEADAFVVLHKARIKDPAAVKAQFRKDPEGTKALFGSLDDSAAAPGARVLARASASTPGDHAATEATAVARSGERAKVIARIAQERGCSRREAYAIAERENKELFAAQE